MKLEKTKQVKTSLFGQSGVGALGGTWTHDLRISKTQAMALGTSSLGY